MLGIVEDGNEELLDMVGTGEDPSTNLTLDEIMYLTNIKAWRQNKTNKYTPVDTIDGEEDMIGRTKRSPYQKIKEAIGGLFFGNVRWQEKSTRDKFFFIFEAPSNLARNLTIPLVSDTQWNRFFLILNPTFAPLFAIFVTKTFFFSVSGFPLWGIVLISGVVLSVIVAFTTVDHKPPKYMIIFILFGFLISAMWMYLISGELVSLLRTFGHILRLEDPILGITILGIGNSIVDLVADLIVAKQGFASMAIGGCFGGPAFNLLLGLGISTTYMNIKNFPTPYPVNLDLNILLAFSALALSLFSSACLIPAFHFSAPKKYAIFIILLYFIFLFLTILLELTVIKQSKSY